MEVGRLRAQGRCEQAMESNDGDGSKVPHTKLISKPEDAALYLAEARTVANLDHRHIVPVFDIGSTEDCPCFVVSKYVEATDLSTRIKVSRLKYWDAALSRIGHWFSTWS